MTAFSNDGFLRVRISTQLVPVLVLDPGSKQSTFLFNRSSSKLKLLLLLAMGKPTKSSSNPNTTTTTTTPNKSSARKTQRGGTSTEKAKNRVAAAKPTKSPALPSPPAHNRVDTPTDTSSVCSSQASSTSTRPRLPLFLQKQLAIDIEEAGGINTLLINSSDSQALSLLCNLDEKVYGKRGDPIRRQIHRKVCSWKLFYLEGTYQKKVLERLHVKPAAVLKYQRDKKQRAKYDRKVSLNKPPPGELSDSSSEESSDSEESSSSIESAGSLIKSAASLVPRKVVFDAPLPVSYPPSIIMSSAPSNGAAPPGSGKFFYCLFVSYYYLC